MSETHATAWTPTERRLLALLADGRPHPRGELLGCLPDELGGFGNVRFHLSQIRRRLRQRGEDVLCVLHRRAICYRHVRLLAGG